MKQQFFTSDAAISKEEDTNVMHKADIFKPFRSLMRHLQPNGF